MQQQYNYITIFQKKPRNNMERHIPYWSRRTQPVDINVGLRSNTRESFVTADGSYLVPSIIDSRALQSLSRILRTVFDVKIIENIYKFLVTEAFMIVGPAWGFLPGYQNFQRDWFRREDQEEYFERARRYNNALRDYEPGGYGYNLARASFEDARLRLTALRPR